MVEVVQLWFLIKSRRYVNFLASGDNSLYKICTIGETRQLEQSRTRATEKKCSHRAPESICVTVSEKESVTNLTGTVSCRSIRGDVGVGGEMVRLIKSYRIAFIYRRL